MAARSARRPAASRGPDEAAADFSRGVPAVVLACGKSDFLAAEAERAVRTALGDPAVEGYDGAGTAVGAVLASMRTADMFAAAKLLVVRTDLKWLREASDALCPLFDDPPEGRTLFCRMPDAPGNLRIAKRVREAGGYVDCAPPPPWKMAEWIRGRAASMRLRLDAETVEAAAGEAGESLESAAGFLEKARAFLAECPNAPGSELRELLLSPGARSTLKLDEAVADKDIARASELVQAMLTQGVQFADRVISDEGAVIHAAILPTLARHVHRLLEARLLTDAGDEEGAFRAAGLGNPRNPRRAAFRTRLARIDRAEIERMLEAVVETETALHRGNDLPGALRIQGLLHVLCR